MMLPISAAVGSAPSPKPPALESTRSEPIELGVGKTRLLGLLVVWFVLFQGAETGFVGWLFTIATETGFRDDAANRLVSSYWAAFTFARLLTIVVATRIRPSTLLGLDLIGAISSLLVLLAVPSETVMWAATLAFGFSVASLFPISMALAAERIPGLDGAITSKLFVGASLGGMLTPWLLGYALELSPRGPLWGVFVALVLAAGVLVLLATPVKFGTTVRR
jgi:fucose permease